MIMEEKDRKQFLNFVEENETLIRSNNWGEVYDKLKKTFIYDFRIGQFTYSLYSLDFDPLPYINYVPEGFLGWTNIKNFIIPDNIVEIKRSAFIGCNELENITLSKNIRKIGSGAFNFCNKLKKIILPGNLVEIEVEAFYDCGLESVFIPKSVLKIKKDAFLSCNKLKTVYYEGSEKEWDRLVDESESGNIALFNATVLFNS